MSLTKVLIGSFVFIEEKKVALFKSLIIPFVLLLGLEATYSLDMNTVLKIIVYFLCIALQVVIAITTHRTIILGSNSIPSWGLKSWTIRESVFSIHMVLLFLALAPIYLVIYLPIFLGTIPSSTYMYVSGAISILICSWLLGRMSLVFPGIAIDKYVSFKESWKLTRNHQTLMVMVMAVLPLCTYFIIYLIGMIPYSFVITRILSTFIVVFEITALSCCYQLITDKAYKNG